MTTITPSTATRGAVANDPLALIDVDHVRFQVANAKQAAFFYASAFGFQVEQISDLTTGNRTSAQYLLTQGNIRILLETPLSKDHPAAAEITTAVSSKGAWAVTKSVKLPACGATP